MKKYIISLCLLFSFLLTSSAYSLETFYYWEAALDEDGEIVSMAYIMDYYDDYDDFIDDFGVLITILDDETEIYQELHYADWLEWDQFGNFYVIVGDGDPGEGFDTDDFEDIVVTADTRIKFEISFNQGSDWHLASVKAMSTLGDIWQLFTQGTSVKPDEDGNGDSKSSIERARKVRKEGAGYKDHMLKNGELQLRIK